MLSENLSPQSSALSTPFKVVQDEWVMLAPLGDHPHPLGIQRFTPAFVQNMANRFNGFFARMGRLFSGAPTFEGHHDIEPDKYPNSRSYGWIMALEARLDGLWGRMTWTPEGREMLQNGAFKFVSPVFIGKPIAQENGRTIFEPIMFKSLALTNEPNLPLPPLANTKPATETSPSPLFAEANVSNGHLNRGGVGNAQSLALTNEPNLPLPPLANTKELSTQHSAPSTLISPLANEKDSMTTITEILALQPDATAEQIIEAARALNGRVTTLENENQTLRTSLSAEASAKADVNENARVLANTQTELATLNSQLTTAQSQFASERAARIELILANGIGAGRITLAQRPDWQTKLEKDFASAETALANCAPALNTDSVTRNLGNEKAAYDTEATRRAALTAYIAEQEAAGLNYDAAWAKAKVERADIFANMRK